jgi:hypothetical protein
VDFVNRDRELRALDAAARRGGLVVVHGRRRVGKTRLLRQWLDARGGLYSQAIEAQPGQQLRQAAEDLRPPGAGDVAPATWEALLELLTLRGKRWTLCLDEFPWLVASDPTLPSRLQRWLDHSLPPGCVLVLSGSSTRMMNDLFLNRAAPLFGRAALLLHVQPMDYAAFCAACGLPPGDPASFERFSCVGGIPRWWEFVDRRRDAADLAEDLFFGFAPLLDEEPRRVLRDEGVAGLNALAILEAVGRGAERPSDIASRLGTPQTGLSRLLRSLLDASVLSRDLPFGESVRSTRKSLFRIQDPALRFWFRVYSPHRSRWKTYGREERRLLVHGHAATVFEDHCRTLHPGGARYWGKGLEIDLVAPDPGDRKGLLVAEVKWRRVGAAERRELLAGLAAKWERCPLRERHPRVRFEVLDAGVLGGKSAG